MTLILTHLPSLCPTPSLSSSSDLFPHPHHPSSAAKGTLRNRPILTDPWTAISTSLLAAAIFAVLLELAFATYLPTWLITHFDFVRDLSAAHLGAAGLPALLLSLVPVTASAKMIRFGYSNEDIKNEEGRS